MMAAAAAAGGAPEVIAQLENAAKVLMVRRAAPRPERRLAAGTPRRPLPLSRRPRPSGAGLGVQRAGARRLRRPLPAPSRSPAGLLLRGRPPPRRLVPVTPQPGLAPPRTPRRSSMCRPLSAAPGGLPRASRPNGMSRPIPPVPSPRTAIVRRGNPRRSCK